MSETINGSLSVSNDVIADIAGYAAMTCYGVVGMAEQLQGAESVRLDDCARCTVTGNRLHSFYPGMLDLQLGFGAQPGLVLGVGGEVPDARADG